MDFTEAEAALGQALAQDEAVRGLDDGSAIPNSNTPAPPTAPAAPQQVGQAPVEGQQVEQGSTPQQAEESFTGLDPNQLPEDLKPFYRSMQADYTRKTQQVAPFRQLVEAGIDPATALEAVQMYTAMQDPTYLAGLYQQMGGYLREQGLLPGEATQAQPQPQAPQNPEYQAYLEQFGFDGEQGGLADPTLEYLQRMDQRLQALDNRWEQERQTALQAQQEAMYMQQLQREEAFIRQANPSYSDADFEAIYGLSAKYGGSLIPAQQEYQQMQDRILTNYLQSKQTVGQSVPAALPSGTSAAVPQKFNTLEEAHRAAVQELRAVLGSDG